MKLTSLSPKVRVGHTHLQEADLAPGVPGVAFLAAGSCPTSGPREA